MAFRFIKIQNYVILMRIYRPSGTIFQLVHSDGDKVTVFFTRPYDLSRNPAMVPLKVDKGTSFLIFVSRYNLSKKQAEDHFSINKPNNFSSQR